MLWNSTTVTDKWHTEVQLQIFKLYSLLQPRQTEIWDLKQHFPPERCSFISLHVPLKMISSVHRWPFTSVVSDARMWCLTQQLHSVARQKCYPKEQKSPRDKHVQCVGRVYCKLQKNKKICRRSLRTVSLWILKSKTISLSNSSWERNNRKI